MSKRVDKIMTKYSERDFNALRSIYNFRCLTQNQIFELFYKKSKLRKRNVSQEYLRKKMIQFRKDDLIESSKPLDPNYPRVYFLTKSGITAVKTFFNYPSNVYDINKRITKRGYFTYNELKITQRFIPHQYNLNKFAISAINLLKQNKLDYKYLDERHITETYGIRPDAILSSMGIDMFLEMDMGTESISQLKEKWNHYRSYLKTTSNRKFVILFICNNRGKINERINLIKNTINENFIDCCEDINIYIGIPEKIYTVIRDIIIPNRLTSTTDIMKDIVKILKNNNFQVGLGESISKYLNNIKYTFYIKNGITKKEFLIQEFFGEPMTSISHAIYYKKTQELFQKTFGYKIPLILIGTSEDLLINNSNVFNIDEDILYTTFKRLKTMPFNEAIFKIGPNNNIFSFNQDFIKMHPTEKLSKMPDLSKLRKEIKK